MAPDQKKERHPVTEGPRDADEQEFEFMVADRRGKLAGMWGAELLGLIGQAAHDYARKFRHGGRHHGEAEMAAELESDLKGKASAHEIREKMSHLLAEARRQVTREKDGR
jgi:hypothetical protein